MNAFGSALQELIADAGIKNMNVAAAVQYDVSYISKWISGKVLPSEKNASIVIGAIADYAETEADEEHYRKLEQKYSSAEGLNSGIRHCLMNAYEKSKGGIRESGALEYHSSLPVHTVIEKLWETVDCRPAPVRIVAAIDLFRIDHKSRVLLSGMANGRFRDLSAYKDTQIELLICFQELLSDENCVYDAISLIHLLTGLSSLQLTLYGIPDLRKVLMVVVQNTMAVSGTLLTEDHTCYGAAVAKDTQAADFLYKRLQTMCNEQYQVFRKVTMVEMLDRYEYVQSVLAPHPCWILGHMTEQLLPGNVFQEITEKCAVPGEDAAVIRQVHELTRVILQNGRAKLMIYDSAVTHFLLTGELDFFNRPVNLSMKQRLNCLHYLEELIDCGIEVRLIMGGFSTDFQNVSNPCLFLSDEVSYLRLENGRYEDNLLVVNDRNAAEFFRKFFCTAWEKRSDVVIQDHLEVRNKLERLIQTASRLQAYDA